MGPESPYIFNPGKKNSFLLLCLISFGTLPNYLLPEYLQPAMFFCVCVRSHQILYMLQVLCFYWYLITITGFPDGPVVKYRPDNAGFDPWVRKIHGEGNGNPLQCSCWEIPRTDEPEKLQSMGLKKRHNLATKLQQWL